MQPKNKPLTRHDYQDPGVKKVKRIASIIYVCIMAFVVGGSYLHQQKQQTAQSEVTDLSGFSNP